MLFYLSCEVLPVLDRRVVHGVREILDPLGQAGVGRLQLHVAAGEAVAARLELAQLLDAAGAGGARGLQLLVQGLDPALVVGDEVLLVGIQLGGVAVTELLKG